MKEVNTQSSVSKRLCIEHIVFSLELPGAATDFKVQGIWVHMTTFEILAIKCLNKRIHYEPSPPRDLKKENIDFFNYYRMSDFIKEKCII